MIQPQPSSLDDLQLSLQAYGFLRRTQIHSIADLLEYTQEDLFVLDRSCAEEILAALQRLGLTLPPE